MKILLILSLALMIFGYQVQAAQTTYHCKVNNKGKNIPPEEVVFGYDDELKAVYIYNAYIAHFAGQPVAGEVTEDSAKKQVFNWSLHITNNSGQQTRMAFRAAIFKKDGKALISAKPHGYSNAFSARGTCRETDQKLPGF